MRQRSKTVSISKKKSINPLEQNPINIETHPKIIKSQWIDLDTYLNNDYQSSYSYQNDSISQSLTNTIEDNSINTNEIKSIGNNTKKKTIPISESLNNTIKLNRNEIDQTKSKQSENTSETCSPPPSTPREYSFQRTIITDNITLLSDILINNYDSESISVLEHLSILSKKHYFFKGNTLDYYQLWCSSNIK